MKFSYMYDCSLVIFTHTVVEVTEVSVLVMGTGGTWDGGTGLFPQGKDAVLVIHPEGWGRCVF